MTTLATTLEEYLRAEIEAGHIDHAIRAEIRNGQVNFYIHASGHDSVTLDFVCEGNRVVQRTSRGGQVVPK